MKTPRERFLRTLDFKPVDPPFVLCSYIWEETDNLWRQEGWDGRPLEKVFGTDVVVRVDASYGPAPEFSYEVLEEDERTRTYMSYEGVVVREFKDSHTSMPQFVRWLVASEEDFDRLVAERLSLNPKVRFPEEWKVQLRTSQDSPWPRQCWAHRWGGFFGPLRTMMGLENLCIAFYDQPKLVERMMAQRAESIIAITEEILRYTHFEVFWFWEDMAYNHGSLINPRLFRRLALPYYRQVCDWLHSRGIRHIWLDSDGDISELIPIWLDAGINGLWPFEVTAGNDVVKVRRIYGHDLCIAGGIDKRAVAKGGDTMRREVDRVMPLVEDGGYLPELDHAAPPDISWSHFSEYMAYLLHRLVRG